MGVPGEHNRRPASVGGGSSGVPGVIFTVFSRVVTVPEAAAVKLTSGVELTSGVVFGFNVSLSIVS